MFLIAKLGLTHRMMHGLLVDQFGDFMVQKAVHLEDSTAAGSEQKPESSDLAFEWHRGYEVCY